MITFLSTILSFSTALAATQSTFAPARPPSIPLAVRSPYLHTWQAAGGDGGNGGFLAGQWPTFWSGQITGWAGLIRVDGSTYTWMGWPGGDNGPPTVNQTAFSYTSTRSDFTMDVAGLVTMNITFLSPVTPDDLLRQSLDASYMEVKVQSADGAQHDVALYTDISAEWTSGDRSMEAQWKYGVDKNSGTVSDKRDTTRRQRAERHHARDMRRQTAVADGISYHQVYTTTQQEFTETNQQAAWGTWYYATENVQGLTYQSGADVDVRGQFQDNGVLPNTEDSNYRAIEDDYPVFGFALDLGSVGSESTSSLFTINLLQDNAIQFTDGSGTHALPSLRKSYLSTDLDTLAFFYNDYEKVSSMADDLDSKIATDSLAAAGQDYLTITSLGLRQAWGGLKFAGTQDTPFIFLKEISSDGDIQTVDVIFPMFPMLVYLNPSWLKHLLDPLFIVQEAGLWPEAYSIHDLGFYPNALGHEDGNDESQPLEECGNMIIMTLAYAQKTGDTDYLSQHYDLLNQWTNYLVNDSLTPNNQISTDDFAGSLVNQTDLAVKGMIGIEAMSVIANMTGNTDDGANYSTIARNYISQWQTLGINQDASPPHTTLNYGNESSWGLLYNLYADALLGTKLVPSEVYQMQSDFYPTVELQYGVPLDTRHTYTKNDWEIWAAAISGEDTRNMFISDIATWINETPTNAPATDLYQADSGDFAVAAPLFEARPVVGGWFALLALNQTGIPA